MFTQHPTLLIGPSDWDAAKMPRAEFERRIAMLWSEFPDARHAIVFGSAAHHAELAYLTNFIPKLEPGVALLPRTERYKLLFGGGPNMIGAMKPLTFIDDLVPLSALAKLVDGWSAPLLIGAAYMSTAMRATIHKATRGTARDVTAHVQVAMRRKSQFEISAIGDACHILTKGIAAIRNASHSGASAAAAVLAGERAAIDAGAQDIRSLFSVDGGRTLQPFETNDSHSIDPLQVYIAVRKRNYWAEAFASIAVRPREIFRRAQAALADALAAARPGRSVAEVAEAVAQAIPPFGPHPVTAGAIVAPLGIALDGATTSASTLEHGGCYSVRAGLTDGGNENAIVSAIVSLQEDGAHVLWRDGIG